MIEPLSSVLLMEEVAYSIKGAESRGALRSGKRFAAKNQAYYSSVRELLSNHSRLTAKEPAVATRFLKIADNNRGSLIRTTVRFRADYPFIEHKLREVFLDLFREHTENSTDGFEVMITFNAILTNSDRTTFSVFYGQDFGFDNLAGAANQLRHSDPVVVKSLLDVDKIPTRVDLDSILTAHRHSFDNSNVRIDQILNIVYLIRRFVDNFTVQKRAFKRGQGVPIDSSSRSLAEEEEIREQNGSARNFLRSRKLVLDSKGLREVGTDQSL